MKKDGIMKCKKGKTTDNKNRKFSIVGSNGKIYVKGDSANTVTVESFKA